MSKYNITIGTKTYKSWEEVVEDAENNPAIGNVSHDKTIITIGKKHL